MALEQKLSGISASTRSSSREVLSDNLIIARARARLSQAALAQSASVTRQTISDIERGVANVTLDVLDTIVDALGISIDQLFSPAFTGTVDDVELIKRRASLRDKDVGARDLLVAIDEAAGEPTKGYSAAGRPRIRRSP